MVSKKVKKEKKFFFTFLNWEKQTWYWDNMWLFSIGNGAEILPLEKGRKSPVFKIIFLIFSNFQTWKHFKYNLAEVAYFFKLWEGHLKKIEGHFGTGVLSYFLFLKWLFYINFPVFVFTFGFVILPQVLYRYMVQEPCCYTQNVTFTGKELLTGSVSIEQ